jgi:hypothetical protein
MSEMHSEGKTELKGKEDLLELEKMLNPRHAQEKASQEKEELDDLAASTLKRERRNPGV